MIIQGYTVKVPRSSPLADFSSFEILTLKILTLLKCNSPDIARVKYC